MGPLPRKLPRALDVLSSHDRALRMDADTGHWPAPADRKGEGITAPNEPIRIVKITFGDATYLQYVRYYRAYTIMNIHSVRHQGLHEFLENNSSRRLDPRLVQRIRNIMMVLVLAEDMDEFCKKAPRGWRVHRLLGNRQNQ